MTTCKDCIYSHDIAKAENVIACILIHRGEIDAAEVVGNVFIGWYGKGRLFHGPVVSKNAICKQFKESD